MYGLFMGVSPNEVFETLTERQREVLDLAALHMTSKQIARNLGISHKTVDRRIENIRARLENVPRSDLLRLYVSFTADGGKTPSAFSHLSSNCPRPQSSVRQFESHVTFQDSLVLDERTEWDRGADWRIPEIHLSDFGPGTRILLMLLGAVAIMALAVLTFTASSALSTMLTG